METNNFTIKSSLGKYEQLVKKCLQEKEDQIRNCRGENVAILERIKLGKTLLLKGDEEIEKLVEKVDILKKTKIMLKGNLMKQKLNIIVEQNEYQKVRKSKDPIIYP